MTCDSWCAGWDHSLRFEEKPVHILFSCDRSEAGLSSRTTGERCGRALVLHSCCPDGGGDGKPDEGHPPAQGRKHKLVEVASYQAPAGSRIGYYSTSIHPYIDYVVSFSRAFIELCGCIVVWFTFLGLLVLVSRSGVRAIFYRSLVFRLVGLNTD